MIMATTNGASAATGLNGIKSALQSELGEAFPKYWRHLSSWICNPSSLDDLQFYLSPILKENHELIHLHNLYLRTLLSTASTGSFGHAEPEYGATDLNAFAIDTQNEDIGTELCAQSPTDGFQQFPEFDPLQIEEEAEEDEECEGEDEDDETEMEVDEVRSPSPEEYVPLFEVYMENVAPKRKIFADSGGSSENSEEEVDATDDDEEPKEVAEETTEESEAEEEEDQVEIQSDQEEQEIGDEEEEEEQDQINQMEVETAEGEGGTEIEVEAGEEETASPRPSGEVAVESEGAERVEGDESEARIAIPEVEEQDELETEETEGPATSPTESDDVVVEAEFEEEEADGQEENEDEPEQEVEQSDQSISDAQELSGDDVSTESTSEYESVDSDIETEPFEPKVPVKYLEDMIDANAPRRGSLEVIPNVTHINKLLQKYIEKEPHLEHYFAPRKGPDQPFLTSNASMQGKMLNTLWQNQLINIQTAAVDLIVEASQNHVLTIIKAIMRRRKSYKMAEDGSSQSFGKEMENPHLVHSGDERFHEINSTQKPESDLPIPPNVTESDERERQVVYRIARRFTPAPPKYQTKIGPTELYEAIQANPGLIPSKELRAKLVEQLLMKMHGHNESVLDDDEQNNNDKIWQSQQPQAHCSTNGNRVMQMQSYLDDDLGDEDDEGELFPVCSY